MPHPRHYNSARDQVTTATYRPPASVTGSLRVYLIDTAQQTHASGASNALLSWDHTHTATNIRGKLLKQGPRVPLQPILHLRAPSTAGATHSTGRSIKAPTATGSRQTAIYPDRRLQRTQQSLGADLTCCNRCDSISPRHAPNGCSKPGDCSSVSRLLVLLCCGSEPGGFARAG